MEENGLCKRNKNFSIDEIIIFFISLVILYIQILENGFLGEKKNWWKRILSVQEK